jgi:hypothetical protein
VLAKEFEKIGLSGQGELVQRLGHAPSGYIGNNLPLLTKLLHSGLQRIVGNICQH